MKILAIDTSSNICSVSLLEDDRICDEINLKNEKTHSENLIPLLEKVLSNNSLKLDDIDVISCVTGPGSFTGIRIGISTVKALSFVKNIPIVSVTSLEALARIDETSRTKVSLIDARNNQVYCGIFDKNYKLKTDIFADDISIAIEKMKSLEDFVCIGSGAILHLEKIKKEVPTAQFSDKNEQYASLSGKIAYQKMRNNPDEQYNADTIIPTYFRKSQAERLKKE